MSGGKYGWLFQQQEQPLNILTTDMNKNYLSSGINMGAMSATCNRHYKLFICFELFMVF